MSKQCTSGGLLPIQALTNHELCGSGSRQMVVRNSRRHAMTTLSRVFVALLLTLATVPAFAQITSGHITGQVTDQQGGAIPGVTVVATNSATGFVREAISDDSGAYRLAALPVGTYDISATLSGFRPYRLP
jgi:hypothetical protein